MKDLCEYYGNLEVLTYINKTSLTHDFLKVRRTLSGCRYFQET